LPVGADQVTRAEEESKSVALTSIGEPGIPGNGRVRSLDFCDRIPSPAEFVATTVNVNLVSGVSPVMIAVNELVFTPIPELDSTS
jgi:hypothetical protein